MPMSARALMADADDDNDANDANDSDFAHTPAKILGASFMATPAFDLDGAFGAVDSTVDFDYISPPSPTPLPTSSPSSSAAGKTTQAPGFSTIKRIICPFWWLFCNKLFISLTVFVLLPLETNYKRHLTY